MNFETPTSTDVSALAAMHYACWMDTYRGICADQWLDSLSASDFEIYHRATLKSGVTSDSPFLVVRDTNGGIAGFARAGLTRVKTPTGDAIPAELIAGYSSELYALYVDPKQQRRGIGGRLFDGIVAALRERGHESMCLWVLSGNQKAKRFYESRGGRVVGSGGITLGDRQYDETLYVWTI